MSARLASLALFAALLAFAIGCTPETRWGNQASYAPDLRAYVIARPDPPTLAAGMFVNDSDVARRIVLRDPVSGDKLRCREDLAPLGPITREATTALADENALWKVTLPASLTMPTSYGSSILVVYVGGPLLAFPNVLEHALGAPGVDSLYGDGKRALRDQRFTEAERLFERTLAKSKGPFRAKITDGPERASYFLGALYQREGRDQEAARAYLRFIRRADVRDAKAYDDAEKRLAMIDPGALPPCRSQAPVTFAWPKPR